MSKKILVINPGYGGGIEQGSMYLNDYLLDKGLDSQIIRINDYNDSPKIFNIFNYIFKNTKPDLVLIHELGNITPFSFLKYLYPEIIISYFSLPISLDGTENHYDKRMLDYIISPAYKGELEEKRIRWMFDIPKRFYNAYGNKRPLGRSVYIGRMIESKFSYKFGFLANKNNLNVDIYGNLCRNDSEYVMKMKKLKKINIYKEHPNYNIHNIYREYPIAVLPTKSEAYSLFSVESIIAGCYPIIKVDSHIDKFPWMDNNFPFYTQEEEMVYAIRELNKVSSNALFDLQKSLRDPLVEYFRDISDISVLERIMSPEKSAYYNKKHIDEDMLEVTSWGNKF